MAAKTMWDYLSVVTPDNDVLLNVSPSKMITEDGNKSAVIRIADDGSEERICFSTTPIFYVTLIFTHKNASDAGTIMDYYYSSSKGNGITESFRWIHPTDNHIYTVRFDGKLSRQIIDAPVYAYTYQSVRLRILGTGEKEINVADVESNTEVEEPTVNKVADISAENVESNTEVTEPSVGVV